jgi:hypothetical protein
MFDSLVGANALQRPAARRLADAGTEDAYYRSHEPRHWRLSAAAPLAAIVVLLVPAIDVLPR